MRAGWAGWAMTLGEAPQGNPSLLASHQVPSRAQRQTTLPSSPAAGTSECTGSATPSEVQENIEPFLTPLKAKIREGDPACSSPKPVYLVWYIYLLQIVNAGFEY